MLWKVNNVCISKFIVQTQQSGRLGDTSHEAIFKRVQEWADTQSG